MRHENKYNNYNTEYKGGNKYFLQYFYIINLMI